MAYVALRNQIVKKLTRNVFFLRTHVKQGKKLMIKGSGKRSYHTSLARLPKDQIVSVFNHKTLPSIKHNMVMIADLPHAGDSIFTSTEVVEALDNFNIGHSQMTFIVSADQWIAQKKKEFLQRYLYEQWMRRGAFNCVLVVGGSATKGERSKQLDDNFADICGIVAKSQQKLGLVLNPYQAEESFFAEMNRKADFGPVCYFSQPLFNPYALPDPIRVYMEELMREGGIELSVGLLQTDARMYQTQSMVTVQDKRVNPLGKDKYLLPPVVTGGTGLEHVNTVLDWVSLYHRRPGKALYTRYGVQHDATPLIQMLQGTRWDLRQFLPTGGSTPPKPQQPQQKKTPQIEEVD